MATSRKTRPWISVGAVAAAVMAGLIWFSCRFTAVPELAADEAPGRIELPPAPAEPASPDGEPLPAYPWALGEVDLLRQTPEQAAAKSQGCVVCHEGAGDPHGSTALNLGCVDCHGGDPTAADMHMAHVLPQLPGAWPDSANPVRSYTLLNHESPEYIRFVNPGDLRVAHLSCGTTACHCNEVLQVRKSMMTHGCMLWGSALYNNGSVPFKWPRYGESYSMHGVPQRMQTVPPPTPEEIEKKGILPYLDPLPRFQVSHPGNVLRIFERGGRFVTVDPGVPERLEVAGRPVGRLSNRGLGTANRTDPVFIGLQKTRLFDPTLNFFGTNDHPGDYRSSGCTSCHVIYANDRSPIHSGPYARYGNRGTAAAEVDWRKGGVVTSVDPTIRKDAPGHPIQHKFTTAIPTSQCIVCHVHPGTNVLNSYLGYMWWDEETDGEFFYPHEPKELTAEEFVRSEMSNPDEAAARGLWSEPEFLADSVQLNSQLKHTQLADFHGHGWLFRAVFQRNRKGILLDRDGEEIHEATTRQLQAAIALPQYEKRLYEDRTWSEEDRRQLAALEERLREKGRDIPVHLMDAHLAKGMHCIDCHFVQDVHGDTKLYGEVRAAIEIRCEDCHGDVERRAFEIAGDRPQLRTSGPAAKDASPDGTVPRGRDLTALRTPFGKRRFEVRGDHVIQNSMVEPNVSWRVTQVRDTVDPTHLDYNPLSALSKTVRFDDDGRFAWGDLPAGGEPACAHSGTRISCIACHSSWNPSCYGCHLPQRANQKMPDLHNEGDITKNYVSYNFQTLRDEVYMLGHDGNVTENRIGPARSSCAIHVTSYNGNREAIYTQQQTISAEGLSGIAFSTNVPHTVGGKGQTKLCSDCHVSTGNNNNALLAQLQMLGTNYLNFIGRYCWVAAGEHGLYGVIVTEAEEPQAVIGSTLHHLAFPHHYEEHVERHKVLPHSHHHPGNDISDNVTRPFRQHEVLDLQVRGEFLYAACGEAGLRVYDVAFIDHKGFSERILTAPVSPVGQKFFLRTKYATSVTAATTIAPDPTRVHFEANDEPSIHAIYGYIFVTDREEGLILVGAGTLLDGNPLNNFLERKLTYNPGGLLNGAKSCSIVGNYAYVCCDAGLVVLCMDEPEHPYVTCVLGEDVLHHPTAVDVQFRYGFVCDEEGLKVLDTTDLSQPKKVASLELPEAHAVYVARTYAYVAGGHSGLIIVDVENPEKPKIEEIYDAGGQMNDVHDVKLGITYVSEFAYVADGCNGLRVVQLTSPETEGNYGFSPRPTPHLVATFPLPHGGHVLSVSEGIDRDRAVDESGNQIAVFGRVGAGPLKVEEMRRLYLRPGGSVWKVIDGRRNFAIRPDQREWDLHRQLEEFYNPSRAIPRPQPAANGPSLPSP